MQNFIDEDYLPEEIEGGNEQEPDDLTYLYRHYNKANDLLYVGISLNALNRLAQHKCVSHWFSEIETVKIEKHPTRQAALMAETEAIRDEKPKHNIMKNKGHVFDFQTQTIWTGKKKFVNNSKVRILEQFVGFQPMYTPVELKRALSISGTYVKNAIDTGELKSFDARSEGAKNPVIVCSGWDVIDWLERLFESELEVND